MSDTKRNTIINKIFDEERALYNLKNAYLEGCVFDGPADGESALKESRNIEVNQCEFNLRYPLWHVKGLVMKNSKMSSTCRAPIWYSIDGYISLSNLNGVKALRECENYLIESSNIESPEFGWKCNNITLDRSNVTSEYLFLDSKNIVLKNVNMKGKYSFQYVENLQISNSNLDTKDAFWHSKNVVVRDTVIKGEYLAWFSDGLTLINCKIIGTQPFCY